MRCLNFCISSNTCQKIISSVSVGCLVVCLLPMIFDWKTPPENYSNLDVPPILTAIQSNFFRLSQVACVSASIPSMLHFIGEYVRAPTKSLYYMAAISSFIHLLTIVIPSVLFLSYCSTYGDYKTVILILQCRSIIYTYLTQSYICHFCCWKKLNSYLLFSAIGLNICSSLADILCFQDHQYRNLLYYISFTSYFIGIIALIIYAIRYFQHVRHRMNQSTMSTDEFCCTIYVASILFVNIGYILLTFAIGLTDWLNVSATFLAMYTLLYLVTQVLNTLFLGVAVRREALKTEVCIFRLISSESSDGIL